MKRSEAIKIIKGILSCSQQTIENHAECILTTLEEKGMLPPMSITELSLLNGSRIGKQVTCAWEPEDEEK